MPEESTTMITKAETSGEFVLDKDQSKNPQHKESAFMGITIRAWLALIVVSGVVATHLIITTGVVLDAILRKDFSKVGTYTTIGEPYYSLSIAVVSYFFGQRNAMPMMIPK